MQVFINGQSYQSIHNPDSLQFFLNQLGLPSTKGMAIAVNGEVVPKATWIDYQLQDNDKITLIKATQGG